MRIKTFIYIDIFSLINFQYPPPHSQLKNSTIILLHQEQKANWAIFRSNETLGG